MNASWHAAAEGLVADLQTVFGDRLRSVVAYGPRLEGIRDAPLHCLALVASLSASDLEACAHAVRRWQRAHVAIPLMLPEGEFRRSLDAFPLEYGDILHSHQPVFGADPFAQLEIDTADFRRACETQVKSHLLHLREGFMESRGHPDAVAELVRNSAPAFAALLRRVARLVKLESSGRDDAAKQGAHAAGLPGDLVAELLSLELSADLPSGDPARLFPAYLAAVEQLSHAVDTWRG